jgi:DNA sulfur modification protein DndC
MRIAEIVNDITEAYRSDPRPWVIGFSGGKDSTALLQLAYRALRKLPRSQLTKQVYVVCTDTRIEPPNIIQHVDDMLERVDNAARRDALPLSVHKLTAPLNDRFFVKVIGRGYPAPNRFFRWCTDRLKIRPCSKFIRERIGESGEVVVVLGVRHAEGATRSGSITRHAVNGTRFSRHADLPNAWIYSPIKHLETDALWLYLTLSEPPWGGDNEQLARLYKQANGECPLVIDKSTPTCGGNRFGCWTCTVIKSDKSMQGFVTNGDEWMAPLVEFRDWLKVMRDEARYRRKRRRNGQPGLGPYTLKARREIYQRLIVTEERVRRAPQGRGLRLIETQEKNLIEKLWKEDGYRGRPLSALERDARASAGVRPS